MEENAEKPQNGLLLRFVRENKLTLLLAFIISAAFVLAPIAFYVFWFWSSPISRDPKAFSEFGAFFGGVTGVIISLINAGILGYIAIHLEQIRLDQEEDKRKEEKLLRQTQDTHEEKLRLFAIVREWNSEVTYSCRQKAGKLIRENPTKTLKELHDDFDVDYTCLAVVMGFFTNLNMCIDREIITLRNVVDEFGRIFIWWDEVAVKGKFPKDDWGENDEWEELKKRIKDGTPIEQFEGWEIYGSTTLQKYVANSNEQQERSLKERFSP